MCSLLLSLHFSPRRSSFFYLPILEGTSGCFLLYGGSGKGPCISGIKITPDTDFAWNWHGGVSYGREDGHPFYSPHLYNVVLTSREGSWQKNAYQKMEGDNTVSFSWRSKRVCTSLPLSSQIIRCEYKETKKKKKTVNHVYWYKTACENVACLKTLQIIDKLIIYG